MWHYHAPHGYEDQQLLIGGDETVGELEVGTGGGDMQASCGRQASVPKGNANSAG